MKLGATDVKVTRKTRNEKIIFCRGLGIKFILTVWGGKSKTL